MRLIAENVSYRHPRAERTILAAVSWAWEPGSVTAVVGPSGSGKTTLLALLGGLLRPQGGTISCVGPDGGRVPLRDAATWVLQTVSLLPDRTVEDNVCLGAYLDGVGVDVARARARTALADTGLLDRAGDRAGSLSGGEAQRVAIARALASTRPVLLADEPTGQLDTETTDQVLEALFATARRTVVLVTHDVRAADRCDRILELRGGVLRERLTGAPA